MKKYQSPEFLVKDYEIKEEIMAIGESYWYDDDESSEIEE